MKIDNTTTTNLNLKDSEILNCLTDLVNPYTGEEITGIDNVLKRRLKDIAKIIELVSNIFKTKRTEEYKTIKCGDFNIIVDDLGKIVTDVSLLETLRVIRGDIAKENGIPAYCICSNATLVQLATSKPKTKEDYLETKGIGEKWYNNYAHIFQPHIK